MKYAVRHRYIAYNPFVDVERPRRDQTLEAQESKIRVLTPNEIKPLLDAEENPKYRTLFMLAIMSGARQGELLGLKWSDVDWENCQINIQRTFNNQRWYKPKTKASHRKIDLGPVMMRELKKWRLACPPNALDLIFATNDGGPMCRSTMIRHFFNPALKKAGLSKIRFHDLRHTYASLLIDQGENIKYIQSQLGHSSPTMTLDIYAHLMKPTNQKAVVQLEKTALGSAGHNLVTNEKIGTAVKL